MMRRKLRRPFLGSQPPPDWLESVAGVPFWWHSIDLGKGVVTPGVKTSETLARELKAMRLPDIRGKTVLDVGGWDGYFAFEAERRGAARVAVLDHYMWAMDIPGQQAYWKRCAEEGITPVPYHETRHWQPDTMPGRRGFDVARRILASRVEAFPVDFMRCSLDEVGTWDIVLYLGVLYHMEDPMAALRRLAAVTKERAIIETEAVVVPGYEHEALWRFFPYAELNHDISNWWAPNLPALAGALHPAGFSRAEVALGPSSELLEAEGGPHHYRAIVHAIK